MTTYAFSIAQLDYLPTFDGQSDVVQLVHWRLTGTDGDRTASVAGSTYVPFDPNSPFEPFDDLNADEVIGWVKAELAKNAAPASDPERGQTGLTEADYCAMVDELLAAQPQYQPPWVGAQA